jgi:hypothetical protein
MSGPVPGLPLRPAVETSRAGAAGSEESPRRGPKLTVDQDMTDVFEEMADTWPDALGKLEALCEQGAQ